MKKLITTCVMLTSLTMVSFAQSRATKSGVNANAAAPTSKTAPAATKSATGPTAEQLAERHAKTVQAQYGLNAEQYNNIYAADLDFYNQEKQAKANGGQPGAGQTMQMAMGRDQRYQNTMTPDQFAKYQSANKQTK